MTPAGSNQTPLLPPDPPDTWTPRGPVFWTSVAIGWGVIAYGVVGAVTSAKDTHPRSLAIWILGSLAVHDLVIAPLTFVAAGALRRTLPGRLRAAIQFALITSAALAIVSIPAIVVGSRPDNPTTLPRNYTAGLAIALGIVWLFTAVVLVLGRRRS